MLDAYAEAGGNFLDTADMYDSSSPGGTGGESETPQLRGTGGTVPRAWPSPDLHGVRTSRDRVHPEGITADPYTGDLYTGSYETPPPESPSTTFPHHRLLARFSVPGESARLVNDLAIASDGTAYITDSLRSVVYRVTPGRLAKARDQHGVAPLTPAFDLTNVLEPHEPGTVTLNGIVAAPSGRYLLTVDMAGGDLYRLRLPSGRIDKVALRGGDMSQADGLELHHGMLWAAHPIPEANAISRWTISSDGRTARMTRRINDQALQLPTTLMRAHGRLYVVRSRSTRAVP